MASQFPPLPMQIVVKTEYRDDGGLRAYCDEVPGFVLSNRDPQVVMGAVEEVLEVILSEMFGCAIRVEKLVGVSDAVSHALPPMPIDKRPLNYVGIPQHA